MEPDDALTEIARLIRSHEHTDDPSPTSVPRLRMVDRTEALGPMPERWVPEICLIVEGAKQVELGRDTLSYGRGDYVVAAMDEPMTGTITRAPFLALTLELDLDRLSEVLYAEYVPAGVEPDAAPFAHAVADAELLDVALRLARLGVDPRPNPFLARLYEEELLHRILRGPQGWVLRRALRSSGSLRELTEVLVYLHQFPLQPVSVETLADMIGASASTLHRRFLEVTGRSPLQYRKQLQLQQAQRRLRAGHTVAEVALLVGYRSPSQFSREYRRFFGTAPSQDSAPPPR